jgi:hypothetical protein
MEYNHMNNSSLYVDLFAPGEKRDSGLVPEERQAYEELGEFLDLPYYEPELEAAEIETASVQPAGYPSSEGEGGRGETASWVPGYRTPTVLPRVTAAKTPYGLDRPEAAAPEPVLWRRQARMNLGPRGVERSLRMLAALAPLPAAAPAAEIREDAPVMQHYVRLSGTLFQPDKAGEYRIAMEYGGQIYDLMTFSLEKDGSEKALSGCQVVSVDPYSVLSGMEPERISALLRVLVSGYPQHSVQDMFQAVGINGEETLNTGREIEQLALELAGGREANYSYPTPVQQAAQALCQQAAEETEAAQLRFDFSRPAVLRRGRQQIIAGPYRLLSSPDQRIHLQAEGPGKLMNRLGKSVDRVDTGEDFYLMVPRHDMLHSLRLTAAIYEEKAIPLVFRLKDESGRLGSASPLFLTAWRPRIPWVRRRQSVQIFF